jgi:hypothetical protein
MSEIYGFAINVEGNAIKSIDAIDKSLMNLNNKAQENTSGIAKGFIGAQVAMQAFNMALGAAKSIYTFGVEMEQTNMAFEVMLGSAEKGRAMVNDLKHWADVTPFDNKTTYDAGRMLLQYGIEAKKVIPYMSMLGDISGGNVERFQRLTYSFGQVQSTAKLTGLELREMMMAGFNPLKIMAGDSTEKYEKLKKSMAGGGITFQMVVDAMKKVTGEGGRFFGMMDKQSQTVGGLWSTALGNAQTAMFGLFQQGSPLLKNFAIAATGLAGVFGRIVTPKDFDVLKDVKMDMNQMFEALKRGNLPLDQRKSLIATMNVQYKDYLKNMLSEKSSINDIAKAQADANGMLDKKIKLATADAYLGEFQRKIGESQAAVLKYTIATQNIKDPEVRKKIREEYNVDPEELVRRRQEAEKGLMLNQLKLQKGVLDLMKAGYEIPAGFGPANAPRNKSLDMSGGKEVAMGTSDMGKVGGGLGQAKTLNITIAKMMEINAQNLDGADLEANATKTVELLLREINNISYANGTM